jgi:hypothetical protein
VPLTFELLLYFDVQDPPWLKNHLNKGSYLGREGVREGNGRDRIDQS